ncbi:MAG TPA: DJ-1/PfpI family protein [Thermoleophilaceae bacterium]|jgi:transcriptional regulator GlxA family with amidase domain
MVVAIPLFERMTALDAVGPYEVIWRVPGVEVKFVAERTGPIRSDRPLGLIADYSFDDLPDPDVVLVPGGSFTQQMVEDEALVGWVAGAHQGSLYTTSVCTGALVLGKAGVLQGLDATTHWAVGYQLAEYGATYLPERVVERGKVITGAGVSAGIDMALTLATRLSADYTAEAIQLLIQYDPKPPYNTGEPGTTPQSIRDYASALHEYNEEGGPVPQPPPSG